MTVIHIAIITALATKTTAIITFFDFSDSEDLIVTISWEEAT
jgi:hypothetical protein